MSHPFRCDVAPHRETCGAVRLVTLHNAVTPGHWHVVNNPLLHIVLMDTVVQKFQFLHISFLVTFTRCRVVTVAEKHTLIHCLAKIDLEVKWGGGVERGVSEWGGGEGCEVGGGWMDGVDGWGGEGECENKHDVNAL